MSVIVSNKVVLNAKQARTETLDGREHRVVPIVLMRNGVHTANAGPLYYSDKVNSDRPDRWNYMPLVVYHPEVNGKLVTARSPNILDKRQVGYVFNAGYSDPSVAGEAWFDVEKANKVDERIVNQIDKGETLEVSAGYVLDYEEKPGEYNGEKYTGVVVNTNPDHVAILPDMKGACDVKKGCGAGVHVGNCGEGCDGSCGNKTAQPINNEASFDRIRSALQSAMYKMTDYDGYVRDVYSDFFIYQTSDKLYKRNYTATDDEVTVSEGDPVQVKWVMEYRDMKGNFVGNSSLEPKEPTVADKKTLIKNILAFNAGYEESELNEMTDAQLESTEKTLAKVKKTPVVNKTEKVEEKKETPVVTPQSGEDAFKQFLVANGIKPDELGDLVLGARDIKNDLIANILKSPSNKFDEAWLKDQKLPTLKGIDALVNPVQQTTVGNQQPTPWWGGSNVTTTGVGNASDGPTPLNPVNVFGGPRETVAK